MNLCDLTARKRKEEDKVLHLHLLSHSRWDARFFPLSLFLGVFLCQYPLIEGYDSAGMVGHCMHTRTSMPDWRGREREREEDGTAWCIQRSSLMSSLSSFSFHSRALDWRPPVHHNEWEVSVFFFIREFIRCYRFHQCCRFLIKEMCLTPVSCMCFLFLERNCTIKESVFLFLCQTRFRIDSPRWFMRKSAKKWEFLRKRRTLKCKKIRDLASSSSSPEYSQVRSHIVRHEREAKRQAR